MTLKKESIIMVVKVNFLKVQWEKEAKSSAPVWAVAFASQTRGILWISDLRKDQY